MSNETTNVKTSETIITCDVPRFIEDSIVVEKPDKVSLRLKFDLTGLTVETLLHNFGKALSRRVSNNVRILSNDKADTIARKTKILSTYVQQMETAGFVNIKLSDMETRTSVQVSDFDRAKAAIASGTLTKEQLELLLSMTK